MATSKGGSKSGGGKNSHPGYRSSKTGEFVKKTTADRKPAEHQREQIPNPGRGDTGRKK